MTPLAAQYEEFFKLATGYSPYPYQIELATSETMPSRLAIPTGCGKTAAVVLAWLFRRRAHPDLSVREATPRRLVYCLPMRVLVEQTHRDTLIWLNRLQWAGEHGVARHLLMGGAVEHDWDVNLERDTILVGTQDQLLSRALNRGYTMSRYRWPLHFGALNNDVLWVIDEVQLVGSGLATTAQLQAFRRKLKTYGPARTLWMSATFEDQWLETVDVELGEDAPGRLALGPNDRAEPGLRRRLQAEKSLSWSRATIDQTDELAAEILEAHTAGDLTLVVVNTVRRARALYLALRQRDPAARLVLVHSRFRPVDRGRVVSELLEPPGSQGTIAVATQVVEAGVDISARTLFTEIAPWPSLVQRFGRCNRAGEHSQARVIVIDVADPDDEKEVVKLAPPYEANDLAEAREVLRDLHDVGSARLPRVPLRFDHAYVLRRADLLDLFDTTPDLAGDDIDVSRYIRDTDRHDVSLYWRPVAEEGPGEEWSAPRHDELCSVPLPEIRDLARKRGKGRLEGWVFDPLERVWNQLAAVPFRPGMTLLLDVEAGHYSAETGWTPGEAGPVTPVSGPEVKTDTAYDGDQLSEQRFLTLRQHTDDVVAWMRVLLLSLPIPGHLHADLLQAARWHDAGKAHQVFQASLRANDETIEPGVLLAKTELRRIRHARTGFRHELASALLALQYRLPDLVTYLVAAHHGKVRLSIRALPHEKPPAEQDRLFARGVWDGESIGPIDLGAGVVVAQTDLDLSPMKLGDGPSGPSWVARMLDLVQQPALGPFRLGFLEAIIKAADERASRGESLDEAPGETP